MERRIKIALVGPYPEKGLSPRGGVEVAMVRLAAALEDQPHRVSLTVIAPTTRWDTVKREREKPRVIRVPQGDRFTLLSGMRAWRVRAARVLGELAPDVVHAHSLPGPGLAAADMTLRVSIITVHGHPVREQLASGVTAQGRRVLVDRLSRSAVRRATAVIGVNPTPTMNIPGQAKQFAFIPNIVSEQFWDIPRRPVKGRILYCGGEQRIKGWPELLAAWPAASEGVDDASLRVVGWSGDPPQWTNPPSITVRGWLDNAALRAELAQAEFVVVPSLFEVAPLVIAEAWAAGVPVIACAAGGIPSMVGRAAALVPAGEPAQLAQVLRAGLLGRLDVPYLVATGRRLVMSYRPSVVAAAHLEFYGRLCEQDAKA